MHVDCVLASPRIAQTDPGRWTPLDEVVLSQLVSEQSWCNTPSTYKSQLHFVGEDRLAHIRTIVVSSGGKLTYLFIYLFEIASTNVCGDFGVLVFFLVYEIIWLFVAFVELLELVDDFFSIYESLVICA
jgi:hypothetical protein